MNPLLAALSLPPRLVVRALEDLHRLAEVAPEGLQRLDALDARAEAVLQMGARMEQRADRILEVAERIDSRADAILETGEQLDRRADEILVRGNELVRLGERMHGLVTDATKEAVLVHTRAGEVVASAQDLIAALPTLERAVALASPLEGLVERLGRAADRLPGGQRPRE